jgi:hypothetical protein
MDSIVYLPLDPSPKSCHSSNDNDNDIIIIMKSNENDNWAFVEHTIDFG